MRLRISPGVVFEELGSRTVILDLGAGSYFELNETGSRVWHLIEENRAVEEIRATLMSEFKQPAAVIERDLDQLIQALTARGLVEVNHP